MRLHFPITLKIVNNRALTLTMLTIHNVQPQT